LVSSMASPTSFLRSLSLSLSLVLLTFSGFYTEGATINVSFVNTAYGSWTTQAKDAFNHAMNVWGNTIVSSQVINVRATYEDLAAKENNLSYKGVLGYARPSTSIGNFTSSDPRYDASYYYAIALAETLAVKDFSGFSFEIETSFNSNGNFTWYFGTDGNVPSNEFDFVTVVLHEIAHGLGFSTNTALTDIFSPGTFYAGWTTDLVIFDKYIEDA
jgi:hypothetical protein